MPRFDRSGPQGLGPRTGRGLGLCFGPIHWGWGGGPMFGGWGFGKGMGFGVGPGMRYCSTYVKDEDYRKDLELYQEDLENELEEVKAELQKMNE